MNDLPDMNSEFQVSDSCLWDFDTDTRTFGEALSVDKASVKSFRTWFDTN